MALDANPSLSYKRDTIMLRLLDECMRALSYQGMQKLFFDAVRGGDEGFQSLSTGFHLCPTIERLSANVGFAGFQKWARYRDIWRKA
jgi:hypothetical protein